MKKSIFSLYCLILLLIVAGCQSADTQRANEIIETLRAEYAPDKRVALWDLQAEKGRITGETNLPDALGRLESLLEAEGIHIQNEVKTLPDSELDGKVYGVVTNSVANIRSRPSHSAEMSTQALLGTPLNVLKKYGGWYLVQTPDRYLSWVDAAGFKLLDKDEFEEWKSSEKVVFTNTLGYIHSTTEQRYIVSDLTAGNIIQKTGESGAFYRVVLPDGRKGYIEKQYSTPYREWAARLNPEPQQIIDTATDMMGFPYLWGGTSVKGMDCSGFTKTVYFLNGQVIPRDASQQVHEGELVDTDKNWDNLQVGDLLFFGRAATESSPERVVHVGMWIGNNEFIHSRGRVRISSFDPESPNYDEYELNRYLRTKRILGTKSEHIVPVRQIISS